jgi:nucleoside-diphosphate-sugar epimerase
MRVFVIRAAGVLGRHVIPRLVERGHAVRAVVGAAQALKRFVRWRGRKVGAKKNDNRQRLETE